MALDDSLSIAYFAAQHPGEFGISFYLNYGYTVRAINIDYDTCEGTNVYQSLSELEKITTTIDGTAYTFIVTDTDDRGGHFHYRVEDQEIVNTVTTESFFNCIPAFLFPQAQEVGFNNSDYDVTINNATATETYSFAYDVDRSKSQIKPVNYLAIVSGSATLAPVQESNYTSVGLRNSRYDGSKTTKAEYGISPSISARVFKGDVYTYDDDDQLICSKSSDERNIEEYLYVQNQYYYAANWLPANLNYRESTTLDKPAVRYIPAWNANLYGNLPITGVEVTSSDTEIMVSGSRIYSIFPGDYLLMNMLNDVEVVKVVDNSYNSTTKVTTYTVTRNALNDIGYDTGGFSVLASEKWHLYHIVGDQIYGTDGNSIYKLVDKKVYNEATKETFVINQNGGIVYKALTCSV